MRFAPAEQTTSALETFRQISIGAVLWLWTILPESVRVVADVPPIIAWRHRVPHRPVRGWGDMPSQSLPFPDGIRGCPEAVNSRLLALQDDAHTARSQIGFLVEEE